ncbi:MAG: response regulator [Bryobacterales bacterium]|nr:response regulator [Bryobacterales bacterium]
MPLNRAGRTVLLVEDTAGLRSFLSGYLSNAGYRVIDAANGIEALRICGNTAFSIDLLLSDVIMPRMGGRELMERLRLDHPGLRVIFISGFDISHAGRLPDGVSFLAKPFEPEVLLETIERAFTSRQSSPS